MSAKNELRNKLNQKIGQAGLVAKWLPRKVGGKWGPLAAEFQHKFGLSPKQWRKMVVAATNVVEQQMSAKDWTGVNYEHVPSVASARYMKAFWRNDATRYGEFAHRLKTGEAKIHADVAFPHDVYRAVKAGGHDAVTTAQWDALPNYLGEMSVLPISDVSGSMMCTASGSITCLDISVSLGMYCATKNKGAFKDLLMTFSAKPAFHKIVGSTLAAKFNSIERAAWGMNTNVEAALKEILRLAVSNRVPQEDMPKTLLILSDMQFDRCVSGGEQTVLQYMRKQYEAAEYKMPQVVFWQLNGKAKAFPTTANEAGVSLISGFSPAILKSVLANASADPATTMMDTVLVDRYTPVGIEW